MATDPDVQVQIDAQQAEIVALKERVAAMETADDSAEIARDNAAGIFMESVSAKQRAKTYDEQVVMFDALTAYLATL